MHLGNKNWFVTFAAAGLGLAIAGSANATPRTYTWNGTGTAWNSDANWNQQLNGNSDPGSGLRFPGADSRPDDVALIPNYSNDPLLNFDSITVARLQLQSGASLTIDGVSLTVAATAPNDFQMVGSTRIDIDGATGALALQGEGLAHEVGGIISINDSGSELRIISDAITLEPYSTTVGVVVGANSAAKVNILNGAGLTSEIGVEGKMQFVTSGAAAFANMNYVLANVGGEAISFAAGLALYDQYIEGVYSWHAQGNGAKLEFNQEFLPEGLMFVTKGLSGDAIILVNDVLVVSPYPLNGLTHGTACGTNVFTTGTNGFFVWDTNDEAQGCPSVPD